jgi:hypothetical protein
MLMPEMTRIRSVHLALSVAFGLTTVWALSKDPTPPSVGHYALLFAPALLFFWTGRAIPDVTVPSSTVWAFAAIGLIVLSAIAAGLIFGSPKGSSWTIVASASSTAIYLRSALGERRIDRP